MSKNRRRRTARLRAEAAAIERRLKNAVVTNPGGPVLGRANIAYELSERTKGTAHGGMGMIAKLVEQVGLAEEIDSSVNLLKLHKPYHESDHVLNIASAPRGALTYPPHSGEGLEVVSLGPMVYLASKEKGCGSSVVTVKRGAVDRASVSAQGNRSLRPLPHRSLSGWPGSPCPRVSQGVSGGRVGGCRDSRPRACGYRRPRSDRPRCSVHAPSK